MFPIVLPRSEIMIAGQLVRRYKRFFVDIKLDDGSLVTAHCVNTGVMEGLVVPGRRVWLTRASNPNRKLAYTWELIEVEGRIIGANTSIPNRLVGQLLRERRLPWLARWEECVAEKKYGEHSRIDFWLRSGRREHYLEVKNCHLVYEDGRAYFPDCVSERAANHVRELAKVIRPGTTAEVLFCVQVPSARAVRPSDLHDPAFAAAAREARKAGVRFSAIAVQQSPSEIIIQKRIPVDMKPYSIERIKRWRER